MKIIKMKVSKKNGVAIVMVIGLIAIMVPVIIMLSQMGTSQTRLAMKYHENLLTETTAFSIPGVLAMMPDMRALNSSGVE